MNIPAPLAISVALDSDTGLMWGLTMSSQNMADMLLNPDDKVLDTEIQRGGEGH